MTAIAQTRDEALADYRRAAKLLSDLKREPTSYAVPALIAEMEELATVMEKPSAPRRDDEPLQVFSAVPGVRPIWIWAPIVIGTIAWVVVALYATRRYWA